MSFVCALLTLPCLVLALDDAASRDVTLGFVRDAQGELQLSAWGANEEEKDLSRRINAEIKAAFPSFEPVPQVHISATTWDPCYLGPDYDPDRCPRFNKMYIDAMIELDRERRLQEAPSETGESE